MRRRLATALVFGALAWSATAAASGLDGKTFAGEIVDEKGVVRSQDVVTFEEGRFYSVTCARFGFSGTPYWMRLEGDAIHFFTETVHPENGSMLVKGLVRGGHVEWKGLWTKKRWYWSIRREIAFRGTEKK